MTGKQGIKRLHIDQWAWIHAMVSLILWGIFYMSITPPGPLKELGWVLNRLLAMFSVVGSSVAIVGLIISTSNITKTKFMGLAIELSGLVLAICGPLTYFIAQVVLINDDTIRITVASFGYAFSAFILARIVSVYKVLRGSYYGRA